MRPEIRNSLILAARSIQKRNMGPGYTNIAIMGTYVTYITSHLFDIPDMKEYSKKRLKRFYDYTLEKGGFSEYNSPTYTIIALDELLRMRQHITDPESKAIIDSLILYRMGNNCPSLSYSHRPVGRTAQQIIQLTYQRFFLWIVEAGFQWTGEIKKEAQPQCKSEA